jgi:hypothetical protein
MGRTAGRPNFARRPYPNGIAAPREQARFAVPFAEGLVAGALATGVAE